MSMPQGAAVSIGAVLGTGVIALPALAAQAAGPASLLAWAALIVASIPLAVTFATLGARYPDSGGVSTFVRKAFGPRAAAACGWCFCFAVPAGAPAAAMFGGGYVAAALGGGLRTTLITAALLIIAVIGMNLGGLRISGRIQLGLAGLLIVLLLTATIAALPHARLHNLHPFAPHGWLAIGQAAAVLVWGFAGWEAITSLAADFRHPARDLPRATAVALVVVSVLYLGVAATSVAVLGPAAGTTQAPLAALLTIGTGANARLIAAIAAVLLTLGTMNAYIAAAAKTGAALGRDGAAPAWLAPGSDRGTCRGHHAAAGHRGVRTVGRRHRARRALLPVAPGTRQADTGRLATLAGRRFRIAPWPAAGVLVEGAVGRESAPGITCGDACSEVMHADDLAVGGVVVIGGHDLLTVGNLGFDLGLRR